MRPAFIHTKTAVYKAINSVLGALGYRLMPLSMLHTWGRFVDNMYAQRTPTSIGVVIFTRRRAMQLDLLLRSMAPWRDRFGQIVVVGRIDPGVHGDAYSMIRPTDGRFMFLDERKNDGSFRLTTIDALRSLVGSHVLLLVDDMVMCEPPHVPLRSIRPSCVRTLTYPGADPYPLGLGGFLYDREELLAMTRAVWFDSPNSMESALQQFRWLYDRRGLVTTTAFRPLEINTVQEDFVTKVPTVYDPDIMARDFVAGCRLNVDEARKGLVVVDKP